MAMNGKFEAIRKLNAKSDWERERETVWLDIYIRAVCWLLSILNDRADTHTHLHKHQINYLVQNESGIVVVFVAVEASVLISNNNKKKVEQRDAIRCNRL